MAPLHELRRHLGQGLLGKRRVYLDTKFWNDLCDVELGESSDPSARDVLAQLRAACRMGTVVCPAEYHVLAELLRQRLPSKREATAQLIDELSGGAMIVSRYERVMLEVLRFTQGGLGAAQGAALPKAPPLSEVWTRPAFALGHLTPNKPAELPPEVHERAVERTHEALWARKFSDVARELAKAPVDAEGARLGVDEMNHAIRLPENQFDRFEDLYAAELEGTLDGFEESLSAAWLYLYEQAGGTSAEVDAAARHESAMGSKRLILGAFRQQKEQMAALLPTVHVMATAYAKVRWDKQRRFCPNDAADFGHAAAALPYCDCFATEKSLAELIRQTRLEVKYDTTVLTDCRQLEEWLNAPDAGQRPPELELQVFLEWLCEVRVREEGASPVALAFKRKNVFGNVLPE